MTSTIKVFTDVGDQVMGTNSSYPYWYTPNYPQYGVVDYCVENDYELVIFILAADYVGSLNTRVKPCIDACEAAGCKYWISLENVMFYTTGTGGQNPIIISSADAVYDTYVEPILTTIEGYYPSSTNFLGYEFEGVWDIGFHWLRNRTRLVDRDDLKIYYCWNPDFGDPAVANTLYGATSQTADYRLSMADEVSFTLYSLLANTYITPWTTSRLTNCINTLNYQPSGFTKPPTGVQVGMGIIPQVYLTSTWNYLYHTIAGTVANAQLPIPEQMKRAAYYLPYVKQQTGPFENLCIWCSGPIVSPSLTYQDEVTFFTGLNLTSDVLTLQVSETSGFSLCGGV